MVFYGNMFPLLATDLAVIVQGAVALLAIAAGLGWLLEQRDTRGETVSLEDRVRAGGKIASRLQDLVLYTDPPRLAAINRQLGSMRTWPIAAGVRASVEAAGSISVTRGRNLAAKAVGGAIVPGGLFLFGNAKDTTHDNRELFLIVEGPEWAYTHSVDPTQGVAARRFMQDINLRAQEVERSSPAGTPPSPTPTPTKVNSIDQLERLTKLRESGALTPDEFEAQKRALLQLDP